MDAAVIAYSVAGLTFVGSVIAWVVKRGIDRFDARIANYTRRLEYLEQHAARMDERHNALTAQLEFRIEQIDHNLEKIFNKLDENDRNLAILWKTSKGCQYKSDE